MENDKTRLIDAEIEQTWERVSHEFGGFHTVILDKLVKLYQLRGYLTQQTHITVNVNGQVDDKQVVQQIADHIKTQHGASK